MKLVLVSLLLAAGCAADRPTIDISRAYGYAPVLGDVGAVYFTIDNRGADADTLTAVEVGGAAVAMLHEQVAVGGRMQMRHLASLPLPPHSTVQLAPGKLHVMLEGMAHPPSAGDTLRVTLHLARAGVRMVRAPVLTYGTEP